MAKQSPNSGKSEGTRTLTGATYNKTTSIPEECTGMTKTGAESVLSGGPSGITESDGLRKAR